MHVGSSCYPYDPYQSYQHLQLASNALSSASSANLFFLVRTHIVEHRKFSLTTSCLHTNLGASATPGPCLTDEIWGPHPRTEASKPGADSQREMLWWFVMYAVCACIIRSNNLIDSLLKLEPPSRCWNYLPAFPKPRPRTSLSIGWKCPLVQFGGNLAPKPFGYDIPLINSVPVMHCWNHWLILITIWMMFPQCLITFWIFSLAG